LAGNQIFKGIFVGLSDAQLLPKARLYAAAYIESLQEGALFNKVVAQIAEFGSKVNAYWQPFLDKVKTLVLNGTGSIFKVITTDITTALYNRIGHIRKIVFEVKSNGTYKFSGCHSKSAIDELGTNARIEVTIPANAEGVYEAKVFAKGPDGIEIPKSGNQGKSTFFPDSWSEAKILDEVKHAVKNNKGFANGVDATEGYYGFSKNGKIKIQFYYRDSDGFIGSYFPKLD
jgi:Bacterial EndoU nuclease